ncbi:MAG: putative iron-regulated protein, partial [Myxococcota bacterium]
MMSLPVPIRFLPALLLAAFLGGCGATAAAVNPVNPVAPVAPDPASSDRLVVDVATGEVLDRAAAVARLRAARHIYVGETHGSETHHRVQLEVLEALRLDGADLALGIEWLPSEVQPAIDAWFSGVIDEKGFLRQANWKHNWGHHWKHYGPILRWARRHGVPVWALNAPNRLARAVVKLGPKRLPPELARLMPPMDTGNAPHREFFRVQMERVKHAHGRHGHKHKGHKHKGHKHKGHKGQRHKGHRGHKGQQHKGH